MRTADCRQYVHLCRELASDAGSANFVYTRVDTHQNETEIAIYYRVVHALF